MSDPVVLKENSIVVISETHTAVLGETEITGALSTEVVTVTTFEGLEQDTPFKVAKVNLLMDVVELIAKRLPSKAAVVVTVPRGCQPEPSPNLLCH